MPLNVASTAATVTVFPTTSPWAVEVVRVATFVVSALFETVLLVPVIVYGPKLRCLRSRCPVRG